MINERPNAVSDSMTASPMICRRALHLVPPRICCTESDLARNGAWEVEKLMKLTAPMTNSTRMSTESKLSTVLLMNANM